MLVEVEKGKSQNLQWKRVSHNSKFSNAERRKGSLRYYLLYTIYEFLSNQTQFQQILGLPLVWRIAIPHVPLVPPLQAGYANSPDSDQSTLPTTHLLSREDEVEMIDRRKKNPSSRADENQW